MTPRTEKLPEVGTHKTTPTSTRKVKINPKAVQMIVTNAPIPSAVAIIGKDIVQGKSVSEAANHVGDTFNKVHQENKESVKKLVDSTNQACDKLGVFKYVFGVTPWILKNLDRALN